MSTITPVAETTPEAVQQTAILFPGQGVQHPGMGKGLYEHNRVARDTFDEASQCLGYDLAKLCFNGTAAELNDTEVAQPAIVATSTAGWRVLRERGIIAPEDPKKSKIAVAGHSAGELSALVAVEALSFSDGILLARERGRAMKVASEAHPGGMLALLDKDGNGRITEELITELLAQADASDVFIANTNSPNETILSGNELSIVKIVEYVKRLGANVPFSASKLRVTIPAHTEFMEPARKLLEEFLGKVAISPPKYPFISNRTANWEASAAAIKQHLSEQLVNGINWWQIVQRIIAEGYTTIWEVGPRRVLTRMIGRVGIHDVTLHSTEDL